MYIWNGTERNGMEWNGMERNGMERNGAEWSGYIDAWARVDARATRRVRRAPTLKHVHVHDAHQLSLTCVLESGDMHISD